MVAKGPDGLAMSDSRSRINGVVALPDGIRLPAASAPGIKFHQNGRMRSKKGWQLLEEKGQ